jgi:hypothetical protein
MIANPRTPRSAWANWLGFWVFCFATAAIFGHRHREFGAELAVAVSLLLAVRIALGPVGGRVFCVGFVLGVAAEWVCYFWIESSRWNQPGRFNPQALTFPFPLTFQYEKIWPPLEVLLEHPKEFSNVTALNNGLAALGAGSVTSGLLAGLVSSLAWYRLGMRAVAEKLTRPMRRRIDQFNQSERRRRIAHSVFFGLFFGTLGLAGWWKAFGPAAGIICAGLICTTVAAIPWLNDRRPVEPPR